MQKSRQKNENDMQEGVIEVEADRLLLEDKPSHSPVNSAVTHHNVCGTQTSAELRGHREQAHSRSPAGGVLTGGGAATADKTLH